MLFNKNKYITLHTHPDIFRGWLQARGSEKLHGMIGYVAKAHLVDASILVDSSGSVQFSETQHWMSHESVSNLLRLWIWRRPDGRRRAARLNKTYRMARADCTANQRFSCFNSFQVARSLADAAVTVNV